jgi:hypothetical protein
MNPMVRSVAHRLATSASPTAQRVGWRWLDLEQLGALFGTDKVDGWHTHLGRTNCAVYELYLKRWRRRRFTLLEIGVLGGASLRMWQAYFPMARIRGLDIDPNAALPGLDVTIGSQGDPKVLEQLLSPDLDCVIDDGSHINELTIASFEYLFPRLRSGAIYIIEDTINTYGPALLQWPGMGHNAGVSFENDRADIDALLARLSEDCDAPAYDAKRRALGDPPGLPSDRTVSFVHVWPGLVVIGRA